MLVSPYDFSKADTARAKVYGGNVVQCPADQGGPGNPYTFYWHYQNWSTVFPKWIVPQLKAWKRLGANTVRIQGGQNGVWMGLYSQSHYEACLRELCAKYRELRLWMDQCQVGVLNYGDITKPDGSHPGDADYHAALNSVFANVYEPNRDVILCIEAGNQESMGADAAMSAALCRYARGITTMPLLISNLSFTCPDDYLSAPADVVAAHFYPEGWGYGKDAVSLSDKLFAALNTNKPGRPILIEECGIYAGVGTGGRYADKATFIDALFASCFPHPNCAGVLWWGGYGTATDANGSTGISGDWTLWQPPAGAGSDGATDYDPTTIWADTAASRAFGSYGSKNRNLRRALTLPAARTLDATMAPITFDTTLTTQVYQPTAVRAAGSVSVAGSYPVALQLTALDHATGSAAAIGAPLTLYPGQMANAPFALGGVMQPNPGGVALTLAAQAAGGPAALNAMTATLVMGNAPALAAPGSDLLGRRLGGALAGPLARRLGRAV